MSTPLYTTEILRLAASLSDPRQLEREDGRADVRSLTCGSRIQTAVQLDGENRVEAISMQVHACAFGQASSALVERNSLGRTAPEIACAIEELSRWLAGQGEQPLEWPGMEALAVARDRKGRHGAILLPFRALLAAIQAAT